MMTLLRKNNLIGRNCTGFRVQGGGCQCLLPGISPVVMNQRYCPRTGCVTAFITQKSLNGPIVAGLKPPCCLHIGVTVASPVFYCLIAGGVYAGVMIDVFPHASDSPWPDRRSLGHAVCVFWCAASVIPAACCGWRHSGWHRRR